MSLPAEPLGLATELRVIAMIGTEGGTLVAADYAAMRRAADLLDAHPDQIHHAGSIRVGLATAAALVGGILTILIEWGLE